MFTKIPIIQNIKLSSQKKKEIVRYAISFFFAWLFSALISDFPYFKNLFIQSIGLDESLTKITVWLIEKSLNIMGFVTFSQGEFIRIAGTSGIVIAYGCLGFRELAFFVVFVLFQFGSWKNKVWYIPMGIVVLITLNIIRAVIIAIGQYKSDENTQLIHDIVSPVLMYPAILFLWIFWISKYGKPSKQN